MATPRDSELFAFDDVSGAGNAAPEAVLLADAALHDASGSLFSAALLPAGVVVLRQTPRGRHGPVALGKFSGENSRDGTTSVEPSVHRVTWFAQRGTAVTAMAFSGDGAVLAVTTRDGGLFFLPAADLLLPPSPLCSVAVVDDGQTSAGLPSLVAFARAKIRSRSTQLGWCDDDVAVSVSSAGAGAGGPAAAVFQGLAPTVQVSVPREFARDSAGSGPSGGRAGGKVAQGSAGGGAAAEAGSYAAGAPDASQPISADHPTCVLWWRPAQAVLADAVTAGVRAQLGSYEAALQAAVAARAAAHAPPDAPPKQASARPPALPRAAATAAAAATARPPQLAPAANARALTAPEAVAAGMRARMGATLAGAYVVVGHANGRVSIVDPAAAWRQLAAAGVGGGSGSGGSTDIVVWTACLSPTGAPVERLQLHDDAATLRRFGQWSLAAVARYEGGPGPSPARGASLGSFSEPAGGGGGGSVAGSVGGGAAAASVPPRPVIAYPTRIVMQPAVLLVQVG